MVQLAACKAIVPELEEARVLSRPKRTVSGLPPEMTELLDIEVRAVATAREVVEDADVLLSVTNSNVPTFNGDWLALYRRPLEKRLGTKLPTNGAECREG